MRRKGVRRSSEDGGEIYISARAWVPAPPWTPPGHWGRWVHWSRRPLFLALAVLVATVLWAVILSILLSKASTERAALLGCQDLLRTNGACRAGRLGPRAVRGGSV
ncbi:PREDICTED: C-type lectin domain family 4 member G-like [Rhinopithecus bieti]|uniref:C-type lectin domain family 4 member G-like n=1 Tax=Rhinopithecus bieti TaxID=61621 RepID=UPI00083BBC55|nr:PREDICTED: C-type lectin domain family 4 member G-like [Rhinopithecus bieti]